MIQPKIQEVYAYNGVHTIRQKGFFFSPSEFETFKREFGKELLEKAAENAYLCNGQIWNKPAQMYIPSIEIDKESITSVLDDYLKDNKI